MEMNRRNFLAGLGAGSAVGLFGGCRMFSCPAGCASTGDAKLKFGVLSDVHISSGLGNPYDRPGDVYYFRRALEWFRDQGVDAVMIAGDIADNGVCDQLESAMAVWNEVFPGGKAPDGRTVEKLFVTGNHDWEGWHYGNYAERHYKDPAVRAKQILANDYAGNWERIVGEPYAPVFAKTVKGYTFIGAHWVSDRCRGAKEIGVADPAKLIAEVAPKLDPRQPFFYFQHPQPKDTCYGPWGWGQDDGRATRALSPYANAIAFSGHSHYSLTDERTIWQGSFTSICTSSLRYTGLPYDVREAGYEDTRSSKGGQLDQSKVATPYPWQWEAQQGMLVEVYDNRVVIARREFRHSRSLGEDWVLPLPFDQSLSVAARQAKELPPRYPADAKTKTVAYDRMNRAGKKVPCWEVVVPPATAEPATRPFEYEAKVVLEDGTLFCTKYLLAPGFNLPVGDVAFVSPVCIPVAKSELPQGKAFRFEVTPVSSLGTRGKSLVSDTILI